MADQNMTKQEIMSFQGHEFTYVFSNGDTMPAYIKKIDLKDKLVSCWSFSLFTDQGIKFVPLNSDEEAEGACCLAYEDTLEGIIDLIEEIKTTGKLLYKDDGISGSFDGCPL